MDADLVALAEACGVATWYEDWHRQRKEVAPESVIAVLGLLGVDATSPAAIRRALAARREQLDVLPGTVVVRSGSGRPLPHPGTITLEDGTSRDVDEVPADLPLGYHRLVVDGRESTLVVVP